MGRLPAGGGATRVAVVGAGYAGLSAFLELQEPLREAGHDLVLVDRHPYHTFTTEIHTIAGGDEDERDVKVPLTHVVRPPARLRVAGVEGVDTEGGRPRVRLSGGIALSCDAALLAIGYEPEYFGIPGMREHSRVLADLGAAKALRRRFEELRRDGGSQRRVVVVGGGLTGVQLAGEIAETYPDFRLSLLEAAPDIMPGFEPALVAAARRALERDGVRIRAGTQVAAAEKDGLQTHDGERIPYDVLVWTGGIRGSRIVGDSGLDTNRRGQGRVDAYLHALRHGRACEHLFLAGDCAGPIDRASGKPVPPTAQAALQAGRAAGRNLLRSLRGEAPVPFTPHIRGLFVSIGQHSGVGRLGHTALYGLPAIALKHLLEAHHAYDAGGLASLLGRVVHAHRDAEEETGDAGRARQAETSLR